MSHTSSRDPPQGISEALLERNGNSLDKIIRLITFKLVPLFCAMQMLGFLARAAPSQASIDDAFFSNLNLTTYTFGLCTGIFYLSYGPVKFPFLWAFFRSNRQALWLGSILTVWSILTVVAAFLTNQWSFFLYRILLGAVQAGCTPGMYMYLSSYIPNSHITLPLTLVELMQPLSQIVSGPLALLMPEVDGLWGLHGYQWLFLAVGLPGIFVGAAIFALYPNSRKQLRYLDARDKQELEKSLSSVMHHAQGASLWDSIKLVSTNYPLLVIIMSTFFRDCVYTGLLYWLPMLSRDILLDNRNMSDLSKEEQTKVNDESLLVSSMIWALTTLMYLYNGYSANHSPKRNRYIGIPYILGGLSMIFLPLVECIPIPLLSKWLSFLLILGGLAFIMSGSAPASSVMLRYAEGPAKDLGCACYAAIPQIGSLSGPVLIGWTEQMFKDGKPMLSVYGLLLVIVSQLVLRLPENPEDDYKQVGEQERDEESVAGVSSLI